MSNQVHPPLIPVRLEGGPDSLPAHLLATHVRDLTDTVKIKHLGGYEHFRLRSHDGDGPAVFAWTGRTKIAE